MHTSPASSLNRRDDRGIALAVVLVVMVILTLFGIMLLFTTDNTMLTAKNQRDVAICRQAAEAAARQGIQLSNSHFVSATLSYDDTLLACTSGGTNATCPPDLAHLSDSWIVDYPGYPFDATWNKKLYINAGGGNAGNVYVTIYGRNNLEAGTTVLPEHDKDGRVIIVGEAQMTFDGLPPDATRSNVRVRKMIAATIYQPKGGVAGCNSSAHNQSSNYGC